METTAQRTFEMTASTPDGQSDTQTVTAPDEWKARTEFMAFTTIKARGQHVSYTVREVTA